MDNPNCDGSGPHSSPTVKLYPLGGGANLILCLSCWARENRYRYSRAIESRPPDHLAWPARELAFEALATADWGQTRWLATSPYGATVTTTSTIAGHTVTKTQQIELNPLLGPHPSLGRVNTYFAASLVLHPLVSMMLTHGVVRQTWQYGSVGVEAFCVGRNAAVGIKMTF